MHGTPPIYPKGAQKRGIEGWVLLEFDVDADGSVVAPRVVDATPPGIFDAAAIEAVLNWKYEPLRVSGHPTKRSGVHVKVNFNLE